MSRVVVFGYAVIAYALFLFSSAWAAVFLAGPVNGPATSSAATALAIDGALLSLFAVQHSVMARAGFKRRLTRLIPPAAERSTFVLLSGILLSATFGWWQPLPATLWQVGLPWSAPIWVLYGAGWLLVVAATYGVDHADFLGLKQAWTHLRSLVYESPPFVQRRLYAWTRHPMMLGLLVVFWATPHMTVGRLFFAAASTGYILVGIHFEERDLRANIGPEYDEYRQRVPALVGTRALTHRPKHVASSSS
jgi:protein-S-isoprenylcysteine O-methyltransferase Ste14